MNTKQISLLAAFLAAKVEYTIVGGVAVNAHGYIRATNDLDIFIHPTKENARAAFNALLSLGVPLDVSSPTIFSLKKRTCASARRGPHRHPRLHRRDAVRSSLAKPD
jgi:hypothetical protein